MDRYPDLRARCPVCTLGPPPAVYPVPEKDARAVRCSTCGTYKLHGGHNPEAALAALDWPERSQLIRAIRRAAEEAPIFLTPDNIRELVESVTHILPSERRRALLLLLARMTRSPRQQIPLQRIADEWLSLGCVDPSEISFWVQNLRDDGFVDGDSMGPRLTPTGILETERMLAERHDLKQVFVAMWFGSTPEDAAHWMQVYKHGFQLGINRTGLRAKRIDQPGTNNKLCDEIVVEIRRSRAVIADVTGNRPNVYYEAGFAQGLGIPVVFTCEHTKFEPHFDTRQYLTIKWANEEDLAAQLENRLRATVLDAHAATGM